MIREERKPEVKGMNTQELVEYCKAHLGNAKKLIEVGLGQADAEAYVRIYGK